MKRTPSSSPVLLLLLALMGLCLSSRDARGVLVCRIGKPFSAAERDSLERAGIDMREIGWSFYEQQDGFEPDSLTVGVMQPNYLEEDENIALTAADRGGWINVPQRGATNLLVGQVLVDGDPTTAYEWHELRAGTYLDQIRVTLDLGGAFLIRRMQFGPREENPGRFLEGFRIGTSQGGFSIHKGIPPFGEALQVRENAEPDVTVAFEPPLDTRYVQLKIDRTTLKALELAEIEVFGGGFVNRAAYVSDVIDLEEVASWGDITWTGRRDTDAEIDLRTRAGADAHPLIYWEARPEQGDSVQFRGGGGNLTAKEYKAAYDRLPNIFKPGVVVTTGEGGGVGGVAIDESNRLSLDIENWSFWSSPYSFEQPGTTIVSPGPRQYFQLKADFVCTSRDGGKIDYVEFKASVPPSVRWVVGEIWPTRTRVGEVAHFTYYIKPTIREGDLGFDSVEITTPSGFASVDSLRLEGVNQDGFDWVEQEGGGGFEVRLPRKLEPTDSGAVVEVVFNAPVFREVGTLFEGKIFESSHPHEVRQRINPGNAADEAEGDELTVKTSLSESLLFASGASPNPFTPNGDGVNDVLHISYTLLRITAPATVTVAIHDLSGYLVKLVYAGEDAIGGHTRSWGGRDRSGRVVPPGIYLYRISADLDTESEGEAGIVSVAY